MYNYQQINKRFVVNKIVNGKPMCIGSFDTEAKASKFLDQRIKKWLGL